jgi:hypothetical protein
MNKQKFNIGDLTKPTDKCLRLNRKTTVDDIYVVVDYDDLNLLYSAYCSTQARYFGFFDDEMDKL